MALSSNSETEKITNNINSSTDTTEDYFKSIAETIDDEYLQTSMKVDIETNTFITNALEKVIESKSLTLGDTAKLNTINARSTLLSSNRNGTGRKTKQSNSSSLKACSSTF